jgi:ABC-type multidrug transport system ATPase subunit
MITRIILPFYFLMFAEPEAGGAGKIAYENKITAKFKTRKIDVPITVSFRNLYLSLKQSKSLKDMTVGRCIKDDAAASKKKFVLTNVQGSIAPGQVTALMGPSGAGKTTLLSLLRGQAHFADVEGEIYANSTRVASLSELKHEISFVPQDDIMYDDLTVEDNILYAAVLFNRRGMSKPKEVMPMVLYAEELLGIEFIRHSVVGSPEKKGISGGQKKRCSMAMEMMKEASLFFLDEPTSGLDSATSISVLSALHDLGTQGVNIVATLHQPRIEIFALINTLVLLGPGGRLIYCGKADMLSKYFSTRMFTCPVSSNIADYVMDVLAGFIPKDKASAPGPVKETVKELMDAWENTQYAKVSKVIDKVIGQRKQVPREKELTWKESWTAFKKAFYVVRSRQGRIVFRLFDSVLYNCLVTVFLGALIGALFGKIGMDPEFLGASAVGKISCQCKYNSFHHTEYLAHAHLLNLHTLSITPSQSLPSLPLDSWR